MEIPKDLAHKSISFSSFSVTLIVNFLFLGFSIGGLPIFLVVIIITSLIDRTFNIILYGQ